MKISSILKHEYSVVRPFLYKKPSATSINIKMFVLLFLQFLLLICYKDFKAVHVIFSCTCASVFCYVIRFITHKEPVYTIFIALVQGMLIGMLLPENYPPIAAGLLTFFVLLGAKYMIPNPSNFWVNPVAFTVVIAWFIGKEYFPSFQITQDMMMVKNPSLGLIQNGALSISSIDSLINGFLNQTVFRFLKVSVPDGYISFMWDSHALIPAFRFNILTVLASIVLFSDDSVDFRFPSIFLFVYLLLVRLFAPVFLGGTFNSGDIILALFSSGTLYVSVFLLQWYGTTPVTTCGKTLLAIVSGIIAFILVGAGTSPVGMCYTILIGNIISVFIKVLETRFEIRSFNSRGVSK